MSKNSLHLLEPGRYKLEANYLKIPPQVSRPDIWAQCQPKLSKAWVEDLPSANYVEATKLILERLRQLNRIKGDPLERFEILEVMRPAVYHLIGYLRSMAAARRFPLNKENKKLAALMFSIFVEFAVSYWLVAQSLSSQLASNRRQKKSATVAQRALASLGQVLFCHYLFKRVEPKGIWLDIHQIYSTFQQVKNSKVVDSSARKLPKTSLEDSYKQLLMLRLSEPYSLLESEVIELFVSLEKWSEMVGLEPLGKIPALKLPCCVINFQEDLAATWIREETQLSSSLVKIDGAALLRLLSDHKEFIDAAIGRYDAALLKGAQLPLSLGLVEQLEQRWSGRKLPASKAFVNRQSRLFLLGLKSIHQHLSSRSHSGEIIQSEWLAESLSDNKLSCDSFEPENISLGQLVGFRKLDDARYELALGVTSNILNQRDGSIEFQMRLLSGKPQAAGIQPVNDDTQAKSYQRVILFFTKEPTGQKVWIVVESKHLKLGRQIRLITSREAVVAAIVRKVNIGNNSYLIECKPLKKAE